MTLLGLLWLLLPLRLGFVAPGAASVYRVVQSVGPWTLLGVFMQALAASGQKQEEAAHV